jgi:hypothetical protein
MALALMVLVASALAITVGELLLRRAVMGPFRAIGVGREEPVTSQPDPVLGWSAKPGRHVMPAQLRGGPSTTMTILPDGSRAAAPRPPDGDRLAVVGCSYSQGWGVNDEDTFAWKLQERFPTLRIGNFATAGFGTLQSLLMLERLFASPDPPRVVIYGMIEHHETRNIADPYWQLTLAVLAREGQIETPYATLAPDGSLLRHPPEGYPHWPLRDQLGLVSQLEFRYTSWRRLRRVPQARGVTEQLLLDMDRTCTQHGAQLLVALLGFDHEDVQAHYARFLREHGVAVADCAVPLTPDLKVPLDSHPNARMHTRYADCIGAAMRERGWVVAPDGGAGDAPSQEGQEGERKTVDAAPASPSS